MALQHLSLRLPFICAYGEQVIKWDTQYILQSTERKLVCSHATKLSQTCCWDDGNKYCSSFPCLVSTTVLADYLWHHTQTASHLPNPRYMVCLW